MIRFSILATAVGVALGLLAAAPADAWDRGDVDVLAVLPPTSSGQPSSVEGLTVGPDGNIYAPTFGFNATGAISGNASLYVIAPNGKLIRQITISGSSPHVLGLRFSPVTKFLLVLDFGAGVVLQVDPTSGTSSVFSGPIPGSGLNALTFDVTGNVYVSDSFNGVIWKIPPTGGAATAWSSDPLLGPGAGLTPPFGANGVQFSRDGKALYVANTAFHQIIKIPVKSDGSADTASIFVTGINAPDGIVFDQKGNLWVCANQEDEIVVIDPTGKVIAKLGDFRGFDEGVARGLLFPASLDFSPDGRTLYVSNLTLYLPYAGAKLAVDSAWTLQAKKYTVSRLKAAIPPLGDDEHDN
jgi:sugar lactone lactonase YvrE